MADAADDAPPPPPKKSGGFMGTLINGIGIFVLTLVAVVVGGFINAKLHPLPDLQVGQGRQDHGHRPGGVPRPRRGRRRRQDRRSTTPSTRRWWSISKMAPWCASCRSPWKSWPTIKRPSTACRRTFPLIRNNLLLLMSNRNYQSMMSREGKEKLRAGGARRDSRRAEERRAARTSTTCCSPASWCSNGRRPQPPRTPSPTKRCRRCSRRAPPMAVRPYDFTAQRINRTQLPLLEVDQQELRRARRRLAVRIAGPRCQHAVHIRWSRSKSADLQAALPVPASLAVVRLKPLPGFAFVSVEPSLLLTLLDGFFGGSGRATADPQAAVAPAAQRFLALMLRSFARGSDGRMGAGVAGRARTREAGDQSAAGAAGRPQRVACWSSNSPWNSPRAAAASTGCCPKPCSRPSARRSPRDGGQSAGCASKRPGRRCSPRRCRTPSSIPARFSPQAQISLRELVRLSPGDIIPIEAPQQVTLLAGDVPLYRGRFGVSQGRNALKILSGASA